MDFPSLIPFTRMVTRALADRLVPTGSEYLDMFHDDAVFDFPFSPGGPVRVEGKAKMAEFLSSIEGGTDFREFSLDASYPMTGDIVVMEYHCRGRDAKSGLPYPQRYVAVLQLRDGRLSLLREYLNPLLNMAITAATKAGA